MPSSRRDESSDGNVADDGGEGSSSCDFVEMPQSAPRSKCTCTCSCNGKKNAENQLTPFEVARIRRMLNSGSPSGMLRESLQQQQQHRHNLEPKPSIDSDHTEFRQSSHAWVVSTKTGIARAPEKQVDRLIGALVISFQLFTYYLFAAEAMDDYRTGQVDVFTTHDGCISSDFNPQEQLYCEAEQTYLADAFVCFSMLGIFLASDVQQAFRSIRKANSCLTQVSAIFVALEVFCAFLAASVSISQKLYIGEVTDAIEAGVGLLFVRELSTRAYQGMRQKRRKAYWSFFAVLIACVTVGMLVHPVCEALLAP